jgi:hypothetical protein
VGFVAKSILSDLRQELNLPNISQVTVYKKLPCLKVAVLMSDPIEIQLDDILRQDFNAETAKIAWMDLRTLFASGKRIYVAHDLELGD